MAELLLVWLGLLVVLVGFIARRKVDAGPLTLAYFLGSMLIAAPGVLPYLGQSYVSRADETLIGLGLTVSAMAAYVVGVILMWLLSGPAKLDSLAPSWNFDAFGWRLLLVGLISYFVLLPMLANVPSMDALITPLGTLLVIGIWLRIVAAVRDRDLIKNIQTIAALPMLPMLTLTAAGFVGYGVNWIICVMCLQFAIVRRRTWFYVASPVVVLIGLSLFVAYMGQRSVIREAVWHENAGIAGRVESILGIFTNVHPLDLNNEDDINALTSRLNQNWLIGAGVQRHEAGLSPLLYGATVTPYDLIPRFIWTDKPQVGAGGQLVSNFTGIDFSEHTAVGIGQVLEFYMNFGRIGVLVGFAALGALFVRIDQGLMRAIRVGDARALLKWGMPGLVLINPQGSLVQMLVGSVAAVLVAHAVSRFDIGVLIPSIRSGGRRAMVS